MTNRIFKSICFAALGVFAASVVLFMGVLYEYFSQEQRSLLKAQTNLAAQGVENEGLEYFDGLDVSDYRITWIASDGTVLYDSEADSSAMENHLEREEFKEALETGSGESSRYSSTLMQRYFYYAERLDDGTVLRLSIAQSTFFILLLRMAQPIGLIAVVAILLSFILARRFSRTVVEPLNSLNLDDPLSNEGYDELSPLLRRIDSQQRQISRQREELRKRQVEFETVTTNMSEGLVLISSSGTVLSINPSAARILGAGDSASGSNILEINRSRRLQMLLNKALSGEHCEKVMMLAGGKYQLVVSPVNSGDETSGAVLLILDVTEKEKAEKLRREFTANVSHELKTPLHTISGCAELMANGIVLQEDIKSFSSRIYDEAQRMIRLVEDIISLSHLDEGAGGMERESVELYALAESVIDELAPEAARNEVRLSLEGSPCRIDGFPQQLRSIIYNLCDNAIKYNRKGGEVKIALKKQENFTLLSVADTGIGIPAEDTERIFERFYRVDKSRSREIGGTGLGLSIVKHAALLHGAEIEVNSVVNEGTTITVKFPSSDGGE